MLCIGGHWYIGTTLPPGGAVGVEVESESFPTGVQLKFCEVGDSVMLQVGVLASWFWQP